jgi:hypothetical protein
MWNSLNLDIRLNFDVNFRWGKNAIERPLLLTNFFICQRIETVAFAFSIMGVIASVTSTFSFGLVNGSNPCFITPPCWDLKQLSGGHVGLVFGWLIPCCFVGFVALSMAELASSMPYVFTPYSAIMTNNDSDAERALVFTIFPQKWHPRSMHL